MKRHVVFALAVGHAACAGGRTTPHLDGRDVDGRDSDGPVAIDASPDAPPGAQPYAHTIAIDGTDDFAVADRFATTSTAYAARVSWDAQNVYVGYAGPDLDPAALDTSSKWLFAYLDLDPGAGTGSTTSVTYNTQHATFPAGFGAELYARWKCDGTFHSLERYQAPSWTADATVVPAAQAGTYVELAIPRSVLGSATTIGLVTWMINEKQSFEGSFAGLYAGNFTDGYAMALPITTYLKIDFAAARAPNDAANQAP